MEDFLGLDREGFEEMVESTSLLTSPLLEKVVFRVKCRDQSQFLEEKILTVWVGHGVNLEQQTKWASLIEFEENEEGTRRFMNEEE